MAARPKPRQSMKAMEDEAGEITEIFKMMSSEEKGQRRGSFNLGQLEGLLTQTELVSNRSVVDNLKEVCLELLESHKKSKNLIESLVNDGIEMRRKMREMESEAKAAKSQVDYLKSELRRQDILLKSVIGKIEENKKELETSVKSSEECVVTKYNEVVRMSKDIENDRNEMSRMNTKVSEVLSSQENQEVKLSEIIDEQKRQKN